MFVDNLTEEQIANLKEVFIPFDKNGDGTIIPNDLGKIVRSLGQNPTDAELQDMINEAQSEDGTISFPEFLSLMARKRIEQDPEEEFIQAFRLYDINRNGFISVADLKQALKNLGENLTDDEFNEIMKEAVINEHGLINYEDFVKMLISK